MKQTDGKGGGEINQMRKQKRTRMLHSWIPFKAMPSSERHTGARQT